MPLDLNSAVDNLIKQGWSDDDIKTVVTDVHSRADDLIRQGKTDEDVVNTLKNYRVLDANNQSLPFFPPKTPNDIATENYNQGHMAGVMPAGFKQQQEDQQALAKQQGVNILEGGGLQAYPTPLETLYPAAKQLTPFPGLTGKAEGEKYGLNPFPAILTDTINAAIEAAKKVPIPFSDTSLGKTIEDYMNASPAFHNFTTETVSNLRYLKGGDILESIKGTPEKPVDVESLRDVSPVALKAPTNGTSPVPESGAQNRPLSNATSPTYSEVTPTASSIVKIEPSAKQGQSGVVLPPADPYSIEIAKSTRDFAIKTENNNLLQQANQYLDTLGIPEEKRTITPMQAKQSTNAAIGVAVEAKRFGELNNVPELVDKANGIINKNGLFKPEDFAQHNLPNTNDFTADLNIIANDKPKVDFQKLQGTAVANPDGTPKEMYHGSPTGFSEFDLGYAKPGLYGQGIYFTDSPEIAGGEGKQIGTVEQLIGANKGKPATEINLGYATPRNYKTYVPEEFNAKVDYWQQKINAAQNEYTDRVMAGVDKKWAKDKFDADVAQAKKQLEELDKIAPTVHPVYLNIKNPFNIDAEADWNEINRIFDVAQKYYPEHDFDYPKEKLEEFEQMNNVTNAEVYKALSKATDQNGKALYKDAANVILEQAGYDGITHRGGAISGGKPHQVYIAFKESQIISKFDPDLYKRQVQRQVENELGLEKYRNLNTKWLIDNNIQPLSVPNTEPIVGLDANVSMALTKRAVEKGITKSNPSFDDLDIPTTLTNSFDKGPDQLPPDGPTPPLESNPNDPFYLPPPDDLNLRGVPWSGKWEAPISIFNKLEAESHIPFLTELHNNKQVADAGFTNMTMTLDKESRELIKEVGKYYNPSKKNVDVREKATDALEKIQHYDRASDQITFKEPNGTLTTSNPVVAAARLNLPLDAVKLAGRLRWLYDEYYNRGATMNPNQYLDFYSPHKMTETQRNDYVKNLRDDQRAFFTYPRSGRVFKMEKDSLKLLAKYQLEWARTKHLMPWQKDVAEPIFQAAKVAYNNVPRKNETLNYLRDYILDTLRYPLDTATNVNSAFYDFVKHRIEPIAPGVAQAIERRFGDDRLGEAFFKETNKGFLNYYLRFRPVPALRNLMQREFLMPLLPGGHLDLIKAQKALLIDHHAQDQALMTGLMPYLEGGLANSNKFDIFSHVESGNMHTGAYIIGNGITEDFRNGMSLGEVRKKWRLHLYPSEIQKRFDDLYTRGMVGDITTLGPIDNAGWMLGRYASMMTQFAKGPGEVPYAARTGPVARSFWLFSTWTPMTIDYFKNLIRDSFYGPNPVMDYARIAKVFLVLYAVDRLYEGITGNNLQANPFMNLPNRAVQAPGPNLAASTLSYVTSKYNEVMNGLIDEHNKSTYEWLKNEAWRNITSSSPGIVKDVRQLTGKYNEQGRRKSSYQGIAP